MITTSNISSNTFSVPMGSFPSATNINQLGLLTPTQIATAYNMPSSTGANVKIGIISLGGGWNATDFNNSMRDMGLNSLVTSANITTVLVDGATGTFTGGDYDGENTLDLYCVAGIAPKANIVIYIGTPSGPNYGTTNPLVTPSQNLTTGFGNIINRAVNENCDIITISWAYPESFVSSGTTYYFGDWLAAPLANAAAKGISVLVASGDYGSEWHANANIVSISYPATSSNVIAVGGTNLTLGSGNVRLTEIVENRDPLFTEMGWGSGGGISTTIPVPSWQSGLTYKRYFVSNSTASSPITLTNRGIPDIAGPMNAYAMWFNGNPSGAGGTSAATPIMAGMMARFMSLSGSRRPIPNAIHPVLYGNLNAYYDITTGNNATTTYLNGYAASSNWDPVTGVGVPWGNVVYQMVSSGGTTIKTGASTWNYIANVKVKTATNTWSNVQAIWTKVDSTTWKQTF